MQNAIGRACKCGLATALVMIAVPVVASSASADNEFLYQGDVISSEEAVSQELVCSDGEGKAVCYDNAAEADAATNGTAARASGGIGPGQPAAAACGVRNLFEYVDAGYNGGGPFLGEGAVGQGWYNYAAQYNADTTSFKTGDYRANFNGHRDGGGLSYGTQPACANTPNLVGSGWNDRFRSRKRFV